MTQPAALPPQAVVPAEPAPGWTSSEFLSTMLVHLLNLVAILLDLLHVHYSKGISATQAAIPVAALTISALLQAAYQNRRTALKMAHIAKVADVAVATVKSDTAPYLTIAHAVEGATITSAPDLAPHLEKLNTVLDALGGVLSSATGVAAGAPPDDTPVAAAAPAVADAPVVETPPVDPLPDLGPIQYDVPAPAPADPLGR